MHGLQRAHLVLDLVDFDQGTLPDIDTLCLRRGLQCQELLNLLQGKAECWARLMNWIRRTVSSVYKR